MTLSIDELFIKLIRNHAAEANTRNHYGKVCDLIRRYKEICGKSTDAIRDELTAEYSKRPAFLDELSKV